MLRAGLRKIGALVVIASVSATTAFAGLPEIVAGPDNAVPQCVTPGRLMAFLKLRNPELNPRYEGIATHYMRLGEAMSVRWDIAFYQMVVETGALSYWRGHRAGDVRPDQNNFAGLGATGNGVHGDSFGDVETGVRAHLEHILLYAGRPVPNPVAERTRKVHEWRILEPWQRSFKRPLTYADLAIKWAPGTRQYASMLEAVGEHFQEALCHAPDPRPELVREARAGRAVGMTPAGEAGAGTVAEAAPVTRVSGEDLAKRALAQAKEEGLEKRSSLGVPPVSEPAVPYKMTSNAAANVEGAGAAPVKASASEPRTSQAAPPKSAAVEKAEEKATEKASAPRYALAGAAGSVGAAAGKAKAAIDKALPPAANQRCRVWTASYGGQRALIIRSVIDQVVNFTVLDVNDGAETREAEAFIAAYAKNGKIAGEYTSQAQALDKAFELCPEG